ncbi:hypothetical protein [Streptomyces sp. NPDC056670]|uniref:hypothetical protein n=1 Tax=Streptomyces sp. NPDC056670 TaxID=3345904 RepID=UPI0036B54E6E
MSHSDFIIIRSQEADSVGSNASGRVGIAEKGNAKANIDSAARSSGWRKQEIESAKLETRNTEGKRPEESPRG